MAKRQDESEASRKKLVELSREFKKSSSEVSALSCPYILVTIRSCHGCRMSDGR